MPDQPEQQSPTQTLPSRAPSKSVARHDRRRKLLAAQDFAQSITFDDPKTKWRWRDGMHRGTLHPSIEKSLIEIAVGRPQALDQRLMDAMKAAAGQGLITLILRKSLTEDPLTQPKPIEGKVIEAKTIEPRASIVPPSRPKRKPAGSGPPLQPGEEELG